MDVSPVCGDDGSYDIDVLAAKFPDQRRRLKKLSSVQVGIDSIDQAARIISRRA
ncbi:MAG: hypothetical protein ACLTZT_16385 [Butyricimonas faecalis]